MIRDDWRIAKVVLQLLSEERVGAPLRRAKALEDEIAKQSRQGIGRR